MLISVVATDFDQEYDPLADTFIQPKPVVQEQTATETIEDEEDNILPSFLGE